MSLFNKQQYQMETFYFKKEDNFFSERKVVSQLADFWLGEGGGGAELGRLEKLSHTPTCYIEDFLSTKLVLSYW